MYCFDAAWIVIQNMFDKLEQYCISCKLNRNPRDNSYVKIVPVFAYKSATMQKDIQNEKSIHVNS